MFFVVIVVIISISQEHILIMKYSESKPTNFILKNPNLKVILSYF